MHPKNIYFCNKKITSKENESANRWKKLNPDYNIILYDDDKIRTFLNDEYDETYLRVFNYVYDGPIKADFWRICILYKYGGVYSDIDNHPFVPISSFLEENINFLTCSSYWVERFKFNPNFIIAEKGDKILEKCINWYLEKYNRRDNYDYWDWSIMNCFTQVLILDNYTRESSRYKLDNMEIQILKEYKGKNHSHDHTNYHDTKVFNNRINNWDYDKHCFN